MTKERTSTNDKDVWISVVLPLYNKEESVSRTVQSILDQSQPYFELIVIDDGSTDSSLSVVQRINDERIVLVSQENSGVSSARNRGMELAKYDYVAFIDGDDLWHPDYLSTIASLRQYDKNSLYYATTWRPWSVEYKRDEKRIEFQSSKVQRMDYFAESLDDVAFHMCSTVVKRNVALEIGGFPEGVKFMEDQDFCARLALLGEILCYPEPLVYYVKDSENRACGRRTIQDMPPFFKSNESLMQQRHEKESKNWYLKEYLITRYLSELSLAAQTPGERVRAI